VGGLCTQEATDGDCWLPAARVLASGEERFVQASSRIVLSVCRLILAAIGKRVSLVSCPEMLLTHEL